MFALKTFSIVSVPLPTRVLLLKEEGENLLALNWSLITVDLFQLVGSYLQYKQLLLLKVQILLKRFLHNNKYIFFLILNLNFQLNQKNLKFSLILRLKWAQNRMEYWICNWTLATSNYQLEIAEAVKHLCRLHETQILIFLLEFLNLILKFSIYLQSFGKKKARNQYSCKTT